MDPVDASSEEFKTWFTADLSPLEKGAAAWQGELRTLEAALKDVQNRTNALNKELETGRNATLEAAASYDVNRGKLSALIGTTDEATKATVNRYLAVARGVDVQRAEEAAMKSSQAGLDLYNKTLISLNVAQAKADGASNARILQIQLEGKAYDELTTYQKKNLIATQERIDATLAAARAEEAAVKRVQAAEEARARAIGSAPSKLKSFGSASTMAVTVPYVIGMGAMAEVSAQYERSQAVFQAANDVTAAEMEKVRQKAIELGRDFNLPATSAKSATESMLAMTRSGMSVEGSIQAVRSAMLLSAATNTSQTEAATILVRVLNAYSEDASHAAQVTDYLTNASMKGGISIASLADGFNQAGSEFAKNKVPMDDFITDLAILTKRLGSGEMAGTQLNQMLLHLEAPTKQAKDVMAALGVSLFDAQGHIKPLNQFIGEFQQAISGATDQERDFAEKTIFGFRALKAVNILLQEGTDGYDRMKGAIDRTGTAQNIAGAQMQGLLGAQARLKTALTDFSTEVGPRYLGVEASIVNKSAEWIRDLGQLSPTLSNTIVIIGGLAAAVGPLTYTVGSAVIQWKNFRAIQALVTAESPAVDTAIATTGATSSAAATEVQILQTRLAALDDTMLATPAAATAAEGGIAGVGTAAATSGASASGLLGTLAKFPAALLAIFDTLALMKDYDWYSKLFGGETNALGQQTEPGWNPYVNDFKGQSAPGLKEAADFIFAHRDMIQRSDSDSAPSALTTGYMPTSRDWRANSVVPVGFDEEDWKVVSAIMRAHPTWNEATVIHALGIGPGQIRAAQEAIGQYSPDDAESRFFKAARGQFPLTANDAEALKFKQQADVMQGKSFARLDELMSGAGHGLTPEQKANILLAKRIAYQEGIPQSLFLALIKTESQFKTNARSKAGAIGLGQLMPGTAEGLGLFGNDIYDPEKNLTASAEYLKRQLEKFHTIPLALAAYNAGPGAVSKYHGVPPFKETQNYVATIMALLGGEGSKYAKERYVDGSFTTGLTPDEKAAAKAKALIEVINLVKQGKLTAAEATKQLRIEEEKELAIQSPGQAALEKAQALWNAVIEKTNKHAAAVKAHARAAQEDLKWLTDLNAQLIKAEGKAGEKNGLGLLDQLSLQHYHKRFDELTSGTSRDTINNAAKLVQETQNANGVAKNTKDAAEAVKRARESMVHAWDSFYNELNAATKRFANLKAEGTRFFTDLGERFGISKPATPLQAAIESRNEAIKAIRDFHSEHPDYGIDPFQALDTINKAYKKPGLDQAAEMIKKLNEEKAALDQMTGAYVNQEKAAREAFKIQVEGLIGVNQQTKDAILAEYDLVAGLKKREEMLKSLVGSFSDSLFGGIESLAHPSRGGSQFIGDKVSLLQQLTDLTTSFNSGRQSPLGVEAFKHDRALIEGELKEIDKAAHHHAKTWISIFRDAFAAIGSDALHMGLDNIKKSFSEKLTGWLTGALHLGGPNAHQNVQTMMVQRLIVAGGINGSAANGGSLGIGSSLGGLITQFLPHFASGGEFQPGPFVVHPGETVMTSETGGRVLSASQRRSAAGDTYITHIWNFSNDPNQDVGAARRNQAALVATSHRRTDALNTRLGKKR